MNNIVFTSTVLILFSVSASAGIECKREKNPKGELVTNCSQTSEKQIKVKVSGDLPGENVADPDPSDNAPAKLMEEWGKPNNATLLDWPCSAGRAPEILIMPVAKNGVRKISISGSYKSPSCGTTELDFPTGLGTVVLDCNALSVRASGQVNLCVIAHDVTSRSFDLAKGIVYFRGSNPSAFLNMDMPDEQGSPQRIVVEGFGAFGTERELFMRGALKLKGPPEEKMQVRNLTVLAGALSLENVKASRVTLRKGVQLYLKNSSIRYLRWEGTGKGRAGWDYLGTVER